MKIDAIITDKIPNNCSRCPFLCFGTICPFVYEKINREKRPPNCPLITKTDYTDKLFERLDMSIPHTPINKKKIKVRFKGQE